MSHQVLHHRPWIEQDVIPFAAISFREISDLIFIRLYIKLNK